MKEIVFEITDKGNNTLFLLNKLANETLKKLAGEMKCLFRYTISTNANSFILTIKGGGINESIALNKLNELDNKLKNFKKTKPQRLSSAPVEVSPDISPIEMPKTEREELEKKTRNELAEMFNIPVQGTKAQMIDKILNGWLCSKYSI